MRFTDKEFFDWEIEHGLYPGGHNKGFYDVHHKLAMFILQFHAGYIDSHLDLGGGNSPLTKILQDHGVKADYVDTNNYSIELQKKLGTKRLITHDVLSIFSGKCQDDDDLTNGIKDYDIVTCIEVLEHIEHEKVLKFIKDLKLHCEYFLFSSTPHKDTPEFDEQWGHVNIKPTDEWIRIFTESGFELLKKETEYLQKNCIPTTWTLMFKSLKHA
jgi:predicted TPR repeat methyltransferase